MEKQKCLCEGDPELSMTRNCRVHCGIKFFSFSLILLLNKIQQESRTITRYVYNEINNYYKKSNTNNIQFMFVS